MMTNLDKYPVDSLSRDFGVALGRSYPKSAQPPQQDVLKPSPRITLRLTPEEDARL